MYHIHIISPPFGEAPLEIRRAWVGVAIPIRGKSKPVAEEWPSFGVLTHPKSILSQIWLLITRKVEVVKGYSVKGKDALDALELHNPEAHRWWLEDCNWNPRHGFIFNVESCLLVNPSSPSEDA